MLAQFIQACQGTLAPALVAMVFSALLGVDEGGDRPRSARWRLYGFLVGLAAAIVFAAVRGTGALTQRTVVTVPTLWACLVADALALAVVFVSRRAVAGWRDHPALLDACNLVAAGAIALTAFRALPGVILQLTNFIETGQPVFTSAMLLRALGFLLGIGLAVGTAVLARSLYASVPRGVFVLCAALLELVVLAQHLTDLLKVLQSVRRVRLHGAAFRLLAVLVNHATWFALAQVAVFLIAVVTAIVSGIRMSPAGPISPRDFRYLPGIPRVLAYGGEPNEVIVRRRRKFRRHAIACAVWTLVASVGVTVALTYGVAATQRVITLSDPEPYQISEGTITIPYTQVEDGHLHRFEYTAADGTVMRFIIIRKNGNSYGVGLDACANCGDAGYYEKDGKIICKKCDVAINLATIGFKGGCNPIPFDYTSQDGAIQIQTTTLDALSGNFS